MIRTDLLELLRNKEKILLFLQINRLIPQEIICPKCQTVKNVTNISNSRCNVRINNTKCNYGASIFKNTFFENAKIDIKKIIMLLYEWGFDTPMEFAEWKYKINQSTVSRWFKVFRNLAMDLYDFNLNNPIGGPNIIIQIDECCITKNKYRQGRILSYQKWIFGGVMHGDNSKFFFEYVQRRDENTLLEIIRRKILPGSIIMSDMWGGYRNLERYLEENNYLHLQVNHRENFINPITGANTQSIEAFWSIIKKNLRKRGTNLGNFEDVQMKIKENLFKKKYRENLFEIMIDYISFIFS